jgi:hypothetical protein
MRTFFKKSLTRQEYQEIVKRMGSRELDGLAETFNAATTLGPVETLIRDVVNAEMESRILSWESQ